MRYGGSGTWKRWGLEPPTFEESPAIGTDLCLKSSHPKDSLRCNKTLHCLCYNTDQHSHSSKNNLMWYLDLFSITGQAQTRTVPLPVFQEPPRSADGFISTIIWKTTGSFWQAERDPPSKANAPQHKKGHALQMGSAIIWIHHPNPNTAQPWVWTDHLYKSFQLNLQQWVFKYIFCLGNLLFFAWLN